MLQAFLILNTEADKQTNIHSVCTILGKIDLCTCWMTAGVVIGLVWYVTKENVPELPGNQTQFSSTLDSD